MQQQPLFGRPDPQLALNACLRSFIASAKSGEALPVPPVEALGLSEIEKARATFASVGPPSRTLLLRLHPP